MKEIVGKSKGTISQICKGQFISRGPNHYIRSLEGRVIDPGEDVCEELNAEF